MVMAHCVVPQGAALGESALWRESEQRLYWIDLKRPTIFRFDPAENRNEAWVLDLPPLLGSIVFCGRRLLLAHTREIFLCDFDARRLRPWVAANDRPEDTMFNDGKIDRQGRYWLGSSHVREADPIGKLYRIAADGGVRVMDEGFACSNGPAFSPDGRRLYFSDTMAGIIYLYDLDPRAGAISGRRIFARFSAEEGYPDGLTVDAEGGLWACHWGGWRVTRFTPEGTRDRVIEVPAPFVTSCAFAGPDLTDLYITTAAADMSAEDAAKAPLAGGLFKADPGMAGLAEPIFADPLPVTA